MLQSSISHSLKNKRETDRDKEGERKGGREERKKKQEKRKGEEGERQKWKHNDARNAECFGRPSKKTRK